MVEIDLINLDNINIMDIVQCIFGEVRICNLKYTIADILGHSQLHMNLVDILTAIMTYWMYTWIYTSQFPISVTLSHRRSRTAGERDGILWPVDISFYILDISLEGTWSRT